MKELFAESPVLLAIILAGIALASFFGWLKSGARPALLVAVTFLLLIPCALLLERAWVTDRENIRDVIESVANALESEDYETIYTFIDSHVGGALAHAKAELPRYEFAEAKVTTYRSIEVNYDMTPPEALADFNVVVDVSDNRFLKNQRVPRRVRVAFRKTQEGWRVIAYEHFPPIGKSDIYSNVGSDGEMPTWAKHRE